MVLPLQLVEHSSALASTQYNILFAALLFLLALLTIIGNVFVIVVVLKDPNQNLKTSSNILIVNLAMADLTLGLVFEPLYAVSFLCPVSTVYLRAVSMGLDLSVEASVLTLLALALERMLVVEVPLRVQQLLTSKRLKIVILFIWIISALIGSGSLIFWSLHKKEYEFFNFDMVGILALVILLSSYGRLLVVVRRSWRPAKVTADDQRLARHSLTQPLIHHQHDNASRNARIRESKVTRMVFLVCGVFLVCWTPSIAYLNIKQTEDNIAFNFCLLIGMMNSALNPVIYSLRTPKFRQGLKKILCW